MFSGFSGLTKKKCRNAEAPPCPRGAGSSIASVDVADDTMYYIVMFFFDGLEINDIYLYDVTARFVRYLNGL